MHIAEKELNRLISYAEGLGLIIIWKDTKELDVPAEIVFTDPPTIQLKRYKKLNYKEVIINMLHELGHYHDWLNNGKREPSKIFTKEHNELTRSEREIVFRDEKKATFIQVSLAKHLELKYPSFESIRLDALYTRWYYKKFVINGKEPSPKERLIKYNKLKQKELLKNAKT